MLRPAILLALLGGGAVQAEGLSLTADERAAFHREVRAAILADPGPVAQALTPPAPDLYSDEAAEDRARLTQNASLFGMTDRGYGAENPRLTLVFYEDYPCADCAAAWAEVEVLLARHPDLRVEPRFAADSGAAQLLLSVLDHQGIAAYRTARAALLAAPTEEALQQAMAQGGWAQDRMLRPQPRQEAEVFTSLELDTVPSSVLPDMMLRGALPAIVLEKYVTR